MSIRNLAGAAVIGGVAIFGGVNAMGDDTIRDDSGDIVEAGGVGVFSIKYGDCLITPSFDEVDEVQSVEGVPCTEPHDSQAYDAFDIVGYTEYPAAEIDDLAVEGCVERFESFVGTPYQDSELYIAWLTPSAIGWEQGDHEVQCMVAPETGLISFDAQNSGR